ncbi:MAG: flavodoxin FldA [Acidobacteriaceae bacterium]|nr:flavodoxin FldA [Acidobacteriaceae bacterium]
MKATIIYGSDTGNTRTAAEDIAEQLGGRSLEVISATVEDFEGCDLLVLGTPTSGYGDLQADWECYLKTLRAARLEGRTVALFGLGDQMTYADTFCDAIGVLYEELMGLGAAVIGATATAGYDFFSSRAVVEGRFVGLVLDEENQGDESGSRIASWVVSLKAQVGELVEA